MEQLLQPTAIPCRQCGTMTRPTQSPIYDEKFIVMEAQWRCPQCGMYLKRGITSRTPKPQSNQ